MLDVYKSRLKFSIRDVKELRINNGVRKNEKGYTNMFDDEDDKMLVKDSKGTVLEEGDSVQLIRDLNVKGSSLNLKRGTTAKNIRLTHKDNEVECRFGKQTIVLKTQYLKKIQ